MKLSPSRLRLQGGLAWMAIVVYPVTQLIVAAAWQMPAYSWSHHYISDLGNTVCGPWGGMYVCSPLHGLMNAGFMLTGLLMLIGGLCFAYLFRRSRWLAAGFALQALGGVGAVIVGLVPENTGSAWHGIGAMLPFLGGNAGLVMIGLAARRWPVWLRTVTALAGIVGLIALALYLSGNYAGLGKGGMERIVDGGRTLWLIGFGLQMLLARASRRLLN